MSDNVPAKPIRFVDGEGITITSCILIIVMLVRAWDATQAVQAPDMLEAFRLYFVEPSRIAQLAPLFFGLVVLGHYFAWLVTTLNVQKFDDSNSDLPRPGTAIVQHVLPPFVVYRPYAILKALMGARANDIVLSIWWGGLWGGITLYALRFAFTLENGAPASMTYWTLTLIMWLLFALSLTCLAYASHIVTRQWNVD